MQVTKISKKYPIQLSLSNREAELLKILVQNSLFDDESEPFKQLRHDLFYTLKQVLEA